MVLHYFVSLRPDLSVLPRSDHSYNTLQNPSSKETGVRITNVKLKALRWHGIKDLTNRV
jgi:hypothetical protein